VIGRWIKEDLERARKSDSGRFKRPYLQESTWIGRRMITEKDEREVSVFGGTSEIGRANRGDYQRKSRQKSTISANGTRRLAGTTNWLLKRPLFGNQIGQLPDRPGSYSRLTRRREKESLSKYQTETVNKANKLA
jgi:hypothetical protein